MTDIVVRAGAEGDAAVILGLWDEAIAWLVARGQPEQWGTEPASARAKTRETVQQWVRGSGVRVAEDGGRPVGVSVIVPSPPDHVPAIARSETYLLFLVSSRACAGQGIGSALVRRAAADARNAGSDVLRVDCWAGAPALIAWYTRQGFVPSDTYTVHDGWRGQVFEMDL
ncbi:MAG TPA: GNAT family N-acetyltransferase [Acidothermaceae bacterium]